ncbi:MAG TPA: histidine kinase [Ignavibacteriaceae bacterium]|nr:histidine kinase [Ignavibacteriaceae bacterium]
MSTKTSKRRNRVYWLCQITGWGLFGGINSTLSTFFRGFDVAQTGLMLLFVILGISSTHILRCFIRTKKWTDLPLKQLTVKIGLATIYIGIIVVSVMFIAGVMTGEIKAKDFNVAYLVVSLINVGGLIIIWSLFYFSFHYFENYKNSEIERLVWEAAVKDFELKTLKSQLNPHFMFNALNSIRSLIEEDRERAKSAITQLSNIFRYSLRIERIETVPLDEEIRTVADYLALEQVRFEDRLNFRIDIQPESKSVEIPPMMIQTLVENGIKHGISKLPEGGIIEIRSYLNENYLKLIIKNSGSIDSIEVMNSKGYGISNTKQRLSLMYGEKAAFSIENVNNLVEAEIKIPIGGSQT